MKLNVCLYFPGDTHCAKPNHDQTNAFSGLTPMDLSIDTPHACVFKPISFNAPFVPYVDDTIYDIKKIIASTIGEPVSNVCLWYPSRISKKLAFLGFKHPNISYDFDDFAKSLNGYDRCTCTTCENCKNVRHESKFFEKTTIICTYETFQCQTIFACVLRQPAEKGFVCQYFPTFDPNQSDIVDQSDIEIDVQTRYIKEEIFNHDCSNLTSITEMLNLNEITFANPNIVVSPNNIEDWLEHLRLLPDIPFAMTDITPFDDPKILAHNSIKDANKPTIENWIYENKKLGTFNKVKGVVFKCNTEFLLQKNIPEYLDIVVTTDGYLTVRFNLEKIDSHQDFKNLEQNIHHICNSATRVFKEKILPNISEKDLELESFAFHYHVFTSVSDLGELVTNSPEILNTWFVLQKSENNRVHLKYQPKLLQRLNANTCEVHIKFEITNKNTLFISVMGTKSVKLVESIYKIIKYCISKFSVNLCKSNKELKMFDKYLFKDAVSGGGYTRSCTNPISKEGIPGVKRRFKRPLVINYDNPKDRMLYENQKHRRYILRYRNNDYVCINDEIENGKFIEAYNKRNPGKKQIEYYNTPFLKELGQEKYRTGDELLLYPCCELEKKSLSGLKLDTLRKAYQKGIIEFRGKGAPEIIEQLEKEENHPRRGDVVHYITKASSKLTYNYFGHLPTTLANLFIKFTPEYAPKTNEFIRKGVIGDRLNFVHATLELANLDNYQQKTIAEKKSFASNLLAELVSQVTFAYYRRIVNKFKKHIEYKELLQLFSTDCEQKIEYYHIVNLLAQAINFNVFVFEYWSKKCNLIAISDNFDVKKRSIFVLRYRNVYDAIIYYYNKRQQSFFEYNQNPNNIVNGLIKLAQRMDIIDTPIQKLLRVLRQNNIIPCGQVLDSFNSCVGLVFPILRIVLPVFPVNPIGHLVILWNISTPFPKQAWKDMEFIANILPRYKPKMFVQKNNKISGILLENGLFVKTLHAPINTLTGFALVKNYEHLNVVIEDICENLVDSIVFETHQPDERQKFLNSLETQKSITDKILSILQQKLKNNPNYKAIVDANYAAMGEKQKDKRTILRSFLQPLFCEIIQKYFRSQKIQNMECIWFECLTFVYRNPNFINHDRIGIRNEKTSRRTGTSTFVQIASFWQWWNNHKTRGNLQFRKYKTPNQPLFPKKLRFPLFGDTTTIWKTILCTFVANVLQSDSRVLMHQWLGKYAVSYGCNLKTRIMRQIWDNIIPKHYNDFQKLIAYASIYLEKTIVVCKEGHRDIYGVGFSENTTDDSLFLQLKHNNILPMKWSNGRIVLIKNLVF